MIIFEKLIYMNKILYVGYIEFPFGLAQVQRQLVMSKMLIHAGYDIKVLCRYGIYSDAKSERKYFVKGNYEGVNYEFCSGKTVRSNNFIIRNLLKIKGAYKELYYIISLGYKKELSAVFVSTNHFSNVVFYWIACRIGRVQIILDNVEYFSLMKDRVGLNKLDAYLYDHFLYLFVDKVICISDFLVTKAEQRMLKTKILKVPAITDYDKFNKKKEEIISDPYLLFCGSIDYYEIIEFAISSYELSHSTLSLYIITKSNEQLNIRIQNSPKKDKIRTFNDLPYRELVSLYLRCSGFIIPLRPNIVDKARFPHKISEFCAACRPFISNNYGEVGVYFKDGINAYLCEEYCIEEYAQKIDELGSDKEKSDLIGQNAYILGSKYFSHREYVDKIKNIIELT
jgi:glycosyltransferase involved in cell wall biosynthesis